jgi:hypothetical protein
MSNRPLDNLPTVRVVSGAESDRRWRDEVCARAGAARDGANRTLEIVLGMWPLFAALGLLMVLMWSFAMFQSP